MMWHRAGVGALALAISGCGAAPYTIDDQPCDWEAHHREHAVSVDRAPETPFAAGQTWVGTYTCAQGETDLALHITSTEGRTVRATFDFAHRESGANGAFDMAGPWTARDHGLALLPVRWRKQPPGYVMVALDGTVSVGGKRLAGHVEGPGCSYFQLRLAR